MNRSAVLAVLGSGVLAWLAWRRWLLPWDRTDLGLLLGLAALGVGWIFALAGWAWRGGTERIHPLRILALLAALSGFALGGELSAAKAFSFWAMPWYSAATLLLVWGALDPARAGSLAAPAKPWPRLLGMTALVAGLGWGLPRVARWFKGFFFTPEDRYSSDLMFKRRLGGGAMDIPGERFDPATLLWLLPVLLGLLALLLAWRRWPRFRPWAPWAAVAWGWLSKPCLAGLATGGIGIMGMKVSSINTAYYGLVEKADAMGWGAFILGFSELQGSLGPHGETHSFLPILVYKGLRLLTLDDPLRVALVLGGLNALIAVPVWRLAERYFGRASAGLVAALLLLSSPLSLILSAAGIDALFALLVALSLERLDAAARGVGWTAVIQAGLAAFAGSLLSYGQPIVNLFFFPWVWWVWAGRRGGWLVGALPAFGQLTAYSVVFLALHLSLYAATAGGFNFLQGMDTAGKIHQVINHFRVYEIWAWGNVILYVGYLGLGLTAAWLWRLAEVLWRGEQTDAWLVLSLALVATLILSAMGRAEVQRMFLYAAAFLAPAAAGVLRFRRAWGAAFHLPGLWLLACANIATAAALQATVLDYW